MSITDCASDTLTILSKTGHRIPARIIKKLTLLLLLLAPFLSGHAQSFDLTNGRVPLASLDGLWRFHTGDDPAMAGPRPSAQGEFQFKRARSHPGL
jgi:hypothetical protein